MCVLGEIRLVMERSLHTWDRKLCSAVKPVSNLTEEASFRTQSKQHVSVKGVICTVSDTGNPGPVRVGDVTYKLPKWRPFGVFSGVHWRRWSMKLFQKWQAGIGLDLLLWFTMGAYLLEAIAPPVCKEAGPLCTPSTDNTSPWTQSS